MPRIPDLVRDSKLETRFHPRYTAHLHQEPDPQEQRRTVTRTEYWKKVKHIGGGGSGGQVWLEECFKGQRHHSQRAVKQIPKFGSMFNAIDYNRELEAMAKFSHHRYVRCFVESYGWFEEKETLSISMEYFQHGDLRVYLQANDPLAEPDARQITFQILEGLSFLHENSFTHRDLKPSNILIKQRPPSDDSWWVKIADFGISKRAEDGTAAASTLKGTLGYMAPESHGFICEKPKSLSEDAVLRAHQSVDMWALGEITFQMLTKEPCFANLSLLSKFADGVASFPSVALQKHNVSEVGISFISAAMSSSPYIRMGVSDALYHKWMEPLRPANSKPASLLSIESVELGKIPETPLFDEFGGEPSAAWSTVSKTTAFISQPQGSGAAASTTTLINASPTSASEAEKSTRWNIMTKAAASKTTQLSRLEEVGRQQIETTPWTRPFAARTNVGGEKDVIWSERDLAPPPSAHHVETDHKRAVDKSRVSRFDFQPSSQGGASKSDSSVYNLSLPPLSDLFAKNAHLSSFQKGRTTSELKQTPGEVPENVKKPEDGQEELDRKLFAHLKGLKRMKRDSKASEQTPSPPSPTVYFDAKATLSLEQYRTAKALDFGSVLGPAPASNASPKQAQTNDHKQTSRGLQPSSDQQGGSSSERSKRRARFVSEKAAQEAGPSNSSADRPHSQSSEKPPRHSQKANSTADASLRHTANDDQNSTEAKQAAVLDTSGQERNPFDEAFGKRVEILDLLEKCSKLGLAMRNKLGTQNVIASQTSAVRAKMNWSWNVSKSVTEDYLMVSGQGRYQLANDFSPHRTVNSQSAMIVCTPPFFVSSPYSLPREARNYRITYKRVELPRIRLLLFLKVEKDFGLHYFRSQLAKAICCILGEDLVDLTDANNRHKILSRDQVTICIYFGPSVFGDQLAFDRMELHKLGLIEFSEGMLQHQRVRDALDKKFGLYRDGEEVTGDPLVAFPRLYQYTGDESPDADPVRPFLKSLLAFDHRKSNCSAQQWMKTIAEDLNVPFAFSYDYANHIGKQFSEQWRNTLQSKGIQSWPWYFDPNRFEIIDYKMTLADKMALAGEQNAMALI